MYTIYKRVLENCELRNLSGNTKRSYMRVIKQFSEYFNKSPEELGSGKIRENLLYLKRDKRQATQTLSGAYSALKFFYHAVLGRPWEISPVPRVKLERKLPVVLSAEEITALLSVIGNIKHKALLTIIYSAGLRTSEAVHLRISDIDSSRMQIRIQHSKGAKDRILPKSAGVKMRNQKAITFLFFSRLKNQLRARCARTNFLPSIFFMRGL